MHNITINNRFWVPIKTKQISFYPKPEFNLLKTLTIKKCKLKLRKKYCRLYMFSIRINIKKILEKQTNKKWILTKKKTIMTSLNIKTDYKKFRPLYIKGYTLHHEFIYGFKNQVKIPISTFKDSWEIFKKYRNENK
jgi:hypothetical protein